MTYVNINFEDSILVKNLVNACKKLGIEYSTKYDYNNECIIFWCINFSNEIIHNLLKEYDYI